MKFEQLKLKNQLCFPVYAASRLIIREYQPILTNWQSLIKRRFSENIK